MPDGVPERGILRMEIERRFNARIVVERPERKAKPVFAVPLPLQRRAAARAERPRDARGRHVAAH